MRQFMVSFICLLLMFSTVEAKDARSAQDKIYEWELKIQK